MRCGAAVSIGNDGAARATLPPARASARRNHEAVPAVARPPASALTHKAAGNPQAYVQMKAGQSQGSITERYIHAAQVLFPGAAARAEERMFGALRG